METTILDRKQREEIRELLRTRQHQLAEEIGSAESRAGLRTDLAALGEVRDAGDESVALLTADLDLSIRDQRLHQLRDVQDAYARIEDESYGSCAECGIEIDFQRLKAQPSAKRCIVCQGEYEKRSAMVSGRRL